MKDTDWMTKANAEKLARRITAYWKSKGRKYSVWVEPLPFHENGRDKTLYSIRSDIKFRAYPDFYGNNIKEP